MTRGISRAILKVVGGYYLPDTGLTVTIYTDEGSPVLVATASESPSGSGQYVATFTSVEKWGYWYVGGSKKSEWGQWWLGESGGGTSPTGAANQLLGMNAGASAFEWKTLAGTTNQVTVTHAAGSATLSLPQNIHTAATPTFGGILLGTNPAASGLVRLANAGEIRWRNAANGADASAIWTDSSNHLQAKNLTASAYVYVLASDNTGLRIAAGIAAPSGTTSLGDSSNRWAGIWGTTGNLSGALTLGNSQIVPSGGVLRLIGSSTGNANLSYLAFADSGGTDQGYVGDGGAGSADLYLAAYAGKALRLWANNTEAIVLSGADASVTVAKPATFSDSIIGTTAKAWYNNFTSGILGSGFRLDHNLTVSGQSYFEVDNMTIRGTLRAHIFQKDIVRATNGQLFVSDSAVVASTVTVPVSGSFAITTKEDPAPFQAGDILWIKDYSDAGGSLTIYSTYLTVGSVSSTTVNATRLSGSSGYSLKAGMTIVRVGGSASDRQGSILLDAASSGAPFIDIYDGRTSDATVAPKVRLGKLSGITDSIFGVLQGHGLYSQNVYLSGNAQIAGTLGVALGSKVGNTFFAGKLYTNILRAASEKFASGNGWSDPGSSGITITDGYDDSGTASCPAPTGSVSRWVQSAGTNKYRYSVGTAGTGIQCQTRTFTFSVWARGASGGEDLALQIARWTDWAGIASGTFQLTTSWARYTVTGTANGTNPTYLVYAVINQNENSTFYLWGAQLEISATASTYQYKDSTEVTEAMASSSGFGMWATVGGFGGTMQSPAVLATSYGLNVGTYVYIGNGLDALQANQRMLIGLGTTEDPTIRLQDNNKVIQLGIDTSAARVYFGMHDGTRWNLRMGDLAALGGSGFGLELLNSSGTSVFNVKDSGDAQIAAWYFDNTKIWKDTDSSNGVRLYADGTDQYLAVKSSGYDSVKMGRFSNITESYTKASIGSVDSSWTVAVNIADGNAVSWTFAGTTGSKIFEHDGNTVSNHSDLEMYRGLPVSGGDDVRGKTIEISWTTAAQAGLYGAGSTVPYAVVGYIKTDAGVLAIASCKPTAADTDPDWDYGAVYVTLRARIPTDATYVRFYIASYVSNGTANAGLRVSSQTFDYYSRPYVELNQNGFKMFSSPIDRIVLNAVSEGVIAVRKLQATEALYIGNWRILEERTLSGTYGVLSKLRFAYAADGSTYANKGYITESHSDSEY